MIESHICEWYNSGRTHEANSLKLFHKCLHYNFFNSPLPRFSTVVISMVSSVIVSVGVAVVVTIVTVSCFVAGVVSPTTCTVVAATVFI